MSKNKQLFLGILIGALVFGGIPVFADNIEVIFNSVNITVNGEKVETDNILYNGTTYAPLRTVAEIVGMEVDWDADTNTANIVSGGTQPQASVETPPEAPGEAPSAPAEQQASEDYTFTNLMVKDYIVTVDVTNNKSTTASIIFTISFYNDAGERLGSALGAINDMNPGETRTADAIHSDDLSGYTTVRYQIDLDV